MLSGQSRAGGATYCLGLSRDAAYDSDGVWEQVTPAGLDSGLSDVSEQELRPMWHELRASDVPETVELRTWASSELATTGGALGLWRRVPEPHRATARRPDVPVRSLRELAADFGAAATEPTVFVAILLVDEGRVPIPHEPYEVELADGRVVSGRLDAFGAARIDRIPAGDCVVRFPRLARADVRRG